MDLDMYGTLTSNEIDELMKITDEEINYNNIDMKTAIKRASEEFEFDISEAVNIVLDDMKKDFNIK